MRHTLEKWEKELSIIIEHIPLEDRTRAGICLPMIPSRDEWDNFVEEIRKEWYIWKCKLEKYPHCLLVLFSGLAFFKYENKIFWPHFKNIVGTNDLPASQQTFIGDAFFNVAKEFRLRTLESNNQRYFVGTAVYYSGIPLSLWEGFLGVCEWALWQSDWENLTDEQWKNMAIKRAGGRQRLKTFLIDNRVVASKIINELLAARSCLIKDTNLSLKEISEVVTIRPEYLEEVPETVDFLRPSDPESLLNDRVRLCWDEANWRVALHLPPVPVENAIWRFGDVWQPAAGGADLMPVNRAAFEERLSVVLEVSGQAAEIQNTQGLKPFGIFDESKGRFVNIRRSFLPLGDYLIISLECLDFAGSSGWELDDEKINQGCELEDGTVCFVSYMRPALTSRAKLLINGKQKIDFGRKQQINLRVFAGCENTHIFRFALKNEVEMVMEQWPSLILEIPEGFIEDSDVARSKYFQVWLDGQQANGLWRFFHDYEKHGEKWEYYEWRWETPISLGRHEIMVWSQRGGVLPFGTRKSQFVEIVSPTDDAVWPHLIDSDKFFSWVLLSAVQTEPTWEDFWIARHSVVGLKKVSLNQHDWNLLERHGYIELRRRIIPLKSCLAFKPDQGNSFIAQFSGLVNRLYPLIRKVLPLEPIVSKRERGYPPFLEIIWPSNERQYIRNICSNEDIQVLENSLWTH